MDAAERARSLRNRHSDDYVPTARERVEQAAAVAAWHLERFLDPERSAGERRDLEQALEAIQRALATV